MTAQSSKSLFRATKAKPKPDDRQSDMDGLTVQMRPTDNSRRADDFYPTGQPEAIRALAALTAPRGIVIVGLDSGTALVGRDDAWLGEVTGAGEATGERVWRLPLEDAHRELLKSRLADLTNSGGRVAHPIQGAAFLERFTGDVPWAHVDMAALSHDLPRKYLAKGPSGWGVRLLTATAAGLAG